MKIDREIVAFATEAPDERDVRTQPSWRVRAARHDHVIQVWIVTHHRLGFFFDDVGDARVGIVAADSPDGRCREDHIAD